MELSPAGQLSVPGRPSGDARGLTDVTAAPQDEGTAAAGTETASDRRDGEIREALQQGEDQTVGAIASERRDARRTQDRTDTQRRDARDTQEQIDVLADTQRQDARDVQDRINVQADTQRQDAREAQDRIDVQADTQRRDARETQDRIDVQADTQRRDARDAQEQAERTQDSERQDAQDSFDARRAGERREAFEQTVTDHQRADELERANQNLEAFAYSVSHDLRAPLRAMNNYSALLLDEHAPGLGETERGYAENIQAASQQMTQLISALLDLARLARAEVHLQPVDLGAEAAAIAAELQASEPQRRVHFSIQQPALAMADRRLIHTVLQNLLGNAWKFTAGQDNALIELWTTPDGDTSTRCYVRDDGAGFDPAEAGKLFDPFQRMHPASEFPGTGVGLASVRQIVERHGGRVRAVGAVGEGATFSFSLAATNSAQ